MPETILKAPNYFDREIDLTERTTPVGGVPATVIGAADRGPAFTPVSVGSFTDFQNKFGTLDPKLVAPYAVQKYFEAKGSELASVNYIRLLGCGSNAIDTDISATQTYGTVKNAGMKISGSGVPVTGVLSGALSGRVQFLVAKHSLQVNESFGFPMFSENASYSTNNDHSVGTVDNDTVKLVRAVLFTTPDARFMVASGSVSKTFDPNTILGGTDNYEAAFVGTEGALQGKFKLILFSSDGASFANDDGLAGIRVLTASLNPTSDQYVGKILNTNPENFAEKKHLLYLDYAVDDEVATLSASLAATLKPTVAILSGSSNLAAGTFTFGEAFGLYNTRYTTPKTPYFISQPFGGFEYDLFYVEALDDGDYANSQIKVSITNLLASTNPNSVVGSFSLQVRAFGDTDADPQLLEVFNNLSLDPNSDNYIAKVIGDKKTRFDFDQLNPTDRSLVVTGKYGNRSKYIRVIPSVQLESGEVPEKAMPFGFRGHQMLLTNPNLADSGDLPPASAIITGVSASGATNGALLSGSIVPPVPFRFTVTRNPLSVDSAAPGAPGTQTLTDARLYWGVKFERNNNDILNVNVNVEPNKLIESFTKFSGIEKLNILTTGTASDALNNNKFTLAKVALGTTDILTDLTASVATYMKEAAYLRDAVLDPSTYVATSYNNRVTFASLLNSGSAILFNNFSPYAKFTTFLQGGWNGVNIFDKEASRFTDRSTSTRQGGTKYGLANAYYESPGAPSGVNYTGAGALGAENSNVVAYRTAIGIATNPSIANNNILLIPGQRDPLVTDYAMEKNLEYALSFYPMDIESFDKNGITNGRIFDGDTGRFISIPQTTNIFVDRKVDNNAAAAYFPNIVIDDTINNRRVTLPASVAALSALAYNDRVKFPWFAPAGFDRGSLAFVQLTSVRVNQGDRNALFDANINPIVKFPGENYVFFSQNTLQQAASALESINVKRMVLEVKRQIVEIGNRILFEQNTPQLRARFVNEASIVLAGVQLRQGVEKFLVICDQRNNTSEDVNGNRMNAQIRLLPTRAIEYIVMDFVVLPSGVAL